MRASCSVSRRWICVPVLLPIDGEVGVFGVLVSCCLGASSSVSRVLTLMLIRSRDAAENLRSNVCRCFLKSLPSFFNLSIFESVYRIYHARLCTGCVSRHWIDFVAVVRSLRL